MSDAEFLPLSRPQVTEEDIAAVNDVLRSGWITTGTKCAELERKFSERTGCHHAVAISSATAGMHLLLHAMGIGPGDEVITPSLTWVSTVNLITLTGATPVFVDVDRDTLMSSAEDIAALCTERTRLIIPVHYAGATLDLDPLHALSASSGIPLVEDAAHVAGAAYRDVPIGRSGTSIFSFHPIKNMTTGEGGLICTDDEALATRIRMLRFHGLGVDAFDRAIQGRAPQAEVIEPGYKYNLPDMNAVLGVSQLARLDDMNAKRARLATRYLEGLAKIEEIMPLRVPDYPMQHAWHLFIVRLDIDKVGMTRDQFMDELKQQNIGTGLHFRAVHEQKYYRETLPSQAGKLPNTEWNSERIFSLPLFPDMKFEDVDRVIEAMRRIINR
jgi:UDP-4-amino-4-deoxy-L-arabinose-oxoglutarate aminotransferase